LYKKYHQLKFGGIFLGGRAGFTLQLRGVQRPRLAGFSLQSLPHKTKASFKYISRLKSTFFNKQYIFKTET
jgi:hypothetical protein